MPRITRKRRNTRKRLENLIEGDVLEGFLNDYGYLKDLLVEFFTNKPKITNITKKNGKRPRFDIYIGRMYAEFKKDSKWANPFISLERYEKKVRSDPELMSAIRDGELDGKILGCWCKPRQCHGDVLIRIWEETFYNKVDKKENPREVRIKNAETLV